MAGVKHFYIGTYEEGVSPGEAADWSTSVEGAQQKFYTYFSSQQEETEGCIVFTEDHSQTGQIFIGKRNSSLNPNDWKDIPAYCEKMTWTSDLWLRGDRSVLRQVKFTAYSGNYAENRRAITLYQPARVIDIEFIGLQIQANGSYGYTANHYGLFGFNCNSSNWSYVLFKNCELSYYSAPTSGSCLIGGMPYGTSLNKSTARFVGCRIGGDASHKCRGTYSLDSGYTSNQNYVAWAFVNTVFVSGYTEWGGQVVSVGQSSTYGALKVALFVNCTTVGCYTGFGCWRSQGVYNCLAVASSSYGFVCSNSYSSVPVPIINCACQVNSDVNGGPVTVQNFKKNMIPCSDASKLGAATTNCDFWANGVSGAYVGMPTIDGRIKDTGSTIVYTDPTIYKSFGADFPWPVLGDNAILQGDEDYTRVRGTSIDIGAMEYLPRILSLSVSPDYTAEDEGFGTTKFNTIPDAITYYVQNHQGVDYTGCKVVVEKDMEVSAFGWTSALQLTSATQMFVICGRRAKPLVRNPQVKLTISSGTSPMFNLDNCVATGSVPDGIEFRDIEFVCNQADPSEGGLAITVGQTCSAKLLLTRCNFSSADVSHTTAYIVATCEDSYAQNQPSRIIVVNCAFTGPALDMTTDNGNNVAFVNTTFDMPTSSRTAVVSVSDGADVMQRFYNCGFWSCTTPLSNKKVEMWNTFIFKCSGIWPSTATFHNCATDQSSFHEATATDCKYNLNPNAQFVTSGRYGALKFFPKEGSDLITGADDDVLKDMSIYVYGGMMPEQYDPIGTGRPDR